MLLLFNVIIFNGWVIMVFMVYELLYICWYIIFYEYCKRMCNFLRDVFIFILFLLCVDIFLLSWGGRMFFLEKNILFVFIGYEVIIFNLYLICFCGILLNVDCECSWF